MDIGRFLDKDAGKGFEQLPWLNAQNAKKIIGKGADAKILDVREAPPAMRFSDLLVDVEIKKKKFVWGLRANQFNLALLVKKMGSKKTEKWVGKKVRLVTVPGVNAQTRKPTTYINVEN